MQLKQVDLVNPSVHVKADITNVLNPPPEVALILKESCYDCHSNQTIYPWYAKVAPASWLIVGHVKRGREEVNFSEWGTYRSSRALHKLEESFKQVKYKHMPLPAYIFMHADAQLNASERQLLLNWLEKEADKIVKTNEVMH